MKKAIVLALTTATTIVSGSAFAQEGQETGKSFGSQGVIAIGIGIAPNSLFFSPYLGNPGTINVDHTSESTVTQGNASSGGGSTTSFSLAPQLHYFVTD